MFCNSGNCQQISQEVISIRDAMIEDIIMDRRNTIVTVSYRVLENRRTVNRMLSLIVGEQTVMKDARGRMLSVRNLRYGMRIHALVSSAMTASIPPQARAFLITLVQEAQEPTHQRVGRIAFVDIPNHMITLGNPRNINNQVRFVINRNTVIRDLNGRRVGIRQLIPGMNVKVEHSIFQTFSIPPQATALSIQIL